LTTTDISHQEACFPSFYLQMTVIVPAEAMKMLKGMLNSLKILTLHLDGEKSQILSILTASIDHAPKPYHYIVRKSWLFLFWLVGQLEFENLQESSLVPKIMQIISLSLCVLLNYTRSAM